MGTLRSSLIKTFLSERSRSDILSINKFAFNDLFEF
jgi:hypothetical protein